MERRDFLSGIALTCLACSFTGQGRAEGQSQSSDAAKLPRVGSAGTRKGDMLYRELGKTGVQVSAIGLGGFHIGQPALQENDAINLIHSAIDQGITFMDNSWDFNSSHFDSTAKHPEWLGGESLTVQKLAPTV